MSEQAWRIDEDVKDVSSHGRLSCPSLTQASECIELVSPTYNNNLNVLQRDQEGDNN